MRGRPTILSESDIKSVVKMYIEGYQWSDISKEFKIGYPKIRDILNQVELPPDHRAKICKPYKKIEPKEKLNIYSGDRKSDGTYIKGKKIKPYNPKPKNPKPKKTPIYQCTCGLWKREDVAISDICTCGKVMSKTTKMLKPLYTNEQIRPILSLPSNQYIRGKCDDDTVRIYATSFLT